MEFTKLTEGVVRRTIPNCGAQVNAIRLALRESCRRRRLRGWSSCQVFAVYLVLSPPSQSAS